MSRGSWSPAERGEYDDLLAEVVASSTDTSERLDAFEAGLVDAIRAQRYWARDVERTCLRDGLAAEVKRYLDRHRASVSHDGKVLNLPKVQSRRRKREDGTVAYERVLIETWTWDDIERKLGEAIKLRAAMADEIAYYRKLLKLRDLCPEATSPEDAARLLGLVLDEYLGRAA